MRFDAVPVLAPQQQARAYSSKGDRKDLLDAETVKQLSGGSLSGRDISCPVFDLCPLFLLWL